MDGSSSGWAGRGAGRTWPLLGVVVLLAGVNLLNNVAIPQLYLLWAGLALAGLILLASADGLHRGDCGLGPVTRRAAVAAVVIALATAAVMLVGTQLPGVAPAYLDDRVVGMSRGQLALAALVRAPLGTALVEEVAFRGVLLAMLERRFGAVWGVLGSSLAFGVWHVAPALGLAEGNTAVGAALGGHPVGAASAAVVAAGIAGAFLCLLRIRYEHLIVPLAVHVTSTSLGYALAWLMVRS